MNTLLEEKPCLKPRDSATRQSVDLSGIWHIAFEDSGKEVKIGPGIGIPSQAEPIAVPSSYNDQILDKTRRNHVGSVWYYREIWLPATRLGREFFLHFGSVNYRAEVFINGVRIGDHEGGHLPFAMKVPNHFAGDKVTLSVKVNNELTQQTIPPGRRVDYTVSNDGFDRAKQDNDFDFFHYSGIHRRVHLLDLPTAKVIDCTVATRSLSTLRDLAVIGIEVQVEGAFDRIELSIENPRGECVRDLRYNGEPLEIEIPNPILWGIHAGNLYQLSIRVFRNEEMIDAYEEKFGIRTITVEGQQLLLNHEPIYLKGFGRHEESYTFGRHLPDAILVQDFNIMKWIGANSFRTAHYPYSEETLDLADELGFLVIDEISGVGMHTFNFDHLHFGEGRNFDRETCATHCQQMREFIARDKNRASVIMWSVANEAASYEKDAFPYFEELVQTTRQGDDTRPVTIAYHGSSSVEVTPIETKVFIDRTFELVDVICLNRYVSWYGGRFGEPDAIFPLLKAELNAFAGKQNKPVIITEYGADTLAGEHSLTPTPFTEDYQCEFIRRYSETFDACSNVIGEQIWNFADFETKAGLMRINGNKKGVFTRARKPKALAYQLRKRWLGDSDS